MNFSKYVYGSAAVLLFAVAFQSCSLDEPFGDKGEGRLNIVADIRGDVSKVTRAEVSGEPLAALREKCVVYIENTKGIVRKYKGLDNLPSDIRLKTGSYVAEAWSGDSVSASFSAKFYRGYQPFEVSVGNNTLTLHCNIANVIASVDAESANSGLSDMKVTFAHSRGSLQFTEDMFAGAKGYFMMPDADKDLTYKVEGRKSDGSAFIKEGVIENVQRAHEYALRVSSEERPISEGGALIRITIADIPVIDETVEVFSAPAFKGIDFDLDKQVVSLDRNFRDTRVYALGYFGMSSVVMDFSSNFTGVTSGGNILSADYASQLAARGITVETRKSQDAAPSLDGGQVEVDEVYITFSKAFLDALPASEHEYVVTLTATDGRHRTGMAKFRVANDDAAVEHLDPVTTTDVPDKASAPMAITSTRATLTLNIYDEAVTSYGVQYREAGTSEWISAPLKKRARTATRAAVPVEVTLTGLKPGTTYEYRAYAGDFYSEDIRTFSTEGTFSFPNASFEDWSTYQASTMLGKKTVVFPGTGSEPTFWDSGNEGAATGGVVLTDKSTDMVHSGTYSLKTASQAVVGKLAAGNVFVGDYVRTDGTNGVLSMGRPLGMSTHPTKLVAWVNYRPGKSDIIGNSELGLVKGENDHGQMYVALADEPIEIRTNPKNQKLFDPDDEHVLAYGQVTWTDAFGPDGQLAKVEIPLVYNDRAKSVVPTHVVVTCCASKFGDYFSGSSQSVLYLDDIEFVYE